MPRLIDAGKLKEYFKEYTTHSGIQVSLDRYALKVIEEEPTVDAVPVIRCRECRHRLAILMNGQPVVMLCGNERNGEAFPVDTDDYCSRAERKEE